jgi:hypothetical protein
MRGVIRIAAVCVLTTALWVAPAGAQDEERINPCLLTPEQIEDTVGIEVAQDFRGVAECSYATETPGEEGATVGITLLEAESKKEAKQVFKEQKSFMPDNERLKGIGNAAFYSYALGDTVVFRKGATVVSISLLVYTEEFESHQDEVVTLAEIAADNV